MTETPPPATPPGTLFKYDVIAQQLTTHSITVEAANPGDAAVMVGDMLRAGDHSKLRQVSRVIQDVEVRRVGGWKEDDRA